MFLQKTCTRREARVMYHKLALQVHPDKNSGEDLAVVLEAFKMLAAAYSFVVSVIKDDDGNDGGEDEGGGTGDEDEGGGDEGGGDEGGGDGDDRDEYVGQLEAQFEGYLQPGGCQDTSVDHDLTIMNNAEVGCNSTLSQSFESRRYQMSLDGTDRVSKVLSLADDNKLLFQRYAIPMTSGKLKCLKDGTWLNDEVVHMYCLLLIDRDKKRCDVHKDRRRSWVFTSFFMDKLLNTKDRKSPGYCYENVMR